MSTVPPPRRVREIKYPTTDGKPMAETDYHRELMVDLIESLKVFYADEPRVYVSGNLLLFYEKGNKRRHLSPDVFVVPGVGNHRRDNFLLWEEGHGPKFVIELTSSSTRKEDVTKKFALYRDVLKVREYFLFDPLGDYLKPSMQGWRLAKGVYQSIRAVEGRLPSSTTGLHLERDDKELRLWNPETKTWLPSRLEAIDNATRSRDRETNARQEAELAQQEAELAQQEAELAQQAAELAQQAAERQLADAQAEIQRLRERLGIDP
jgi:Uma2 family endonuclease